MIVAVVTAATGGSPSTHPPAGSVTTHAVPLGAFLGSEAPGVAAVPGFQAWLGGPTVTVGHTYLAGNTWTDLEGDSAILDPWAAWRAAAPGRTLVLNVPMVAPNETNLPDAAVSSLLEQGASGAFDRYFQVLAERLVAANAANTIVVLGWEMNGTTYNDRCAPNPAAWKAYWQRIVGVMRSVPGQAFRFDFDPSRGVDDIPWTECYPGDNVVDIIGMDSYDQPPGETFAAYVSEPDGLQAQVDFAAQHGKPVSYPEWGLSDYGDDPAFIEGMYHWISTHDVVYETITDYCPHGVFQCAANPASSREYRALFGGRSGATGSG